MTRRLRLPRWVWVSAVIAVSLVVLYYVVVGFPTTPMTVARADRIFSKGVQAGQSREAVETWLIAQGIPPGSGPYARTINYSILKRDEDATFKGWWMDCRGNLTVAECAGLDVDTVYSVIRVIYPDADRFLFGSTEVTVYLFFDVNGFLIRHWTAEFHISL